MQPRTIARIIAIVDRILSALYTVLVGVIFFLWVFNRDRYEKDGQGGVLWFIFGFLSIICFLQVFAAWNLIKGTNDTVDARKGLRYCSIWCGVTIFFVLMQIMSSIGLIFTTTSTVAAIVISLVTVTFNLASIYFVRKYMKQLGTRLPM